MNAAFPYDSILLTGASGFIGAHLLETLIPTGTQIHLVGRKPPGEHLKPQLTSPNVRWHIHDGSTQGLIDILAQARPQLVFHLASCFLAQHTSQDIEALIQSNILFGAQLLEAMSHNDVHLLVNFGTSWQKYHNADYDPVCLYAATKQAFQDILFFYTQTTPLRAINLLLFDTYGPRDRRRKLFGLLLENMRSGQTLNMSPGDQLLDLVYISDVIAACFVSAGQLRTFAPGDMQTYAVSSGSPVSLRTVVARFEEIAGRKLSIAWGERPYRPREVMIPWNTGANLPGWRPEIDLDQGIALLLNSERPGNGIC